ncbi:MAG: aldo/keto reductase [Acidimicrobiales bacterium]|nr:aldo/keto reductase [Acidimicrobiales bacterium]MCB9393456.1 aldo/keto reductase [Acidimicrobiaceae bacterium]
MALTRWGLGTAPLGNLYSAVDDDTAQATVDAAWGAGIRFFDTAPLYGHGLAEMRLGRALRARPRDEYVLATKVGRVLTPTAGARPASIFRDVPDVDPVFDFGRDGVLRSIEHSLARLGVDRLDVVHVHDPDDHESEALATAFPTLLELRAEGVIGSVGCGMNQVEMLERFVERVDLDCILIAGRWTLLDRRAGDRLLPRCAERGVDVFVGGVFNSGLLADPRPGATFDYAPAGPRLLAAARAMALACARFGVALPTAALGFALRHEAVTRVVIGARSPGEVNENVVAATAHVPAELFTELDSLVP